MAKQAFKSTLKKQTNQLREVPPAGVSTTW